jgi:hypothetical protein
MHFSAGRHPTSLTSSLALNLHNPLLATETRRLARRLAVDESDGPSALKARTQSRAVRNPTLPSFADSRSRAAS